MHVKVRERACMMDMMYANHEGKNGAHEMMGKWKYLYITQQQDEERRRYKSYTWLSHVIVWPRKAQSYTQFPPSLFSNSKYKVLKVYFSSIYQLLRSNWSTGLKNILRYGEDIFPSLTVKSARSFAATEIVLFVGVLSSPMPPWAAPCLYPLFFGQLSLKKKKNHLVSIQVLYSIFLLILFKGIFFSIFFINNP